MTYFRSGLELIYEPSIKLSVLIMNKIQYTDLDITFNSKI